MPNLNRIRGRGGGFGYRGGIARNSGIPGATANRGSSATSYGLSKIHNSDTRIGTQGSANSTRMLPPNAIPRVGRNTQYRPQSNITSRQSKAQEGKIVTLFSLTFNLLLVQIFRKSWGMSEKGKWLFKSRIRVVSHFLVCLV